MLKILITIAGFALVGAGVLGTILPLVPGIPLLLAGAALLGKDHPVVRPFLKRFEQLRERWANRRKD